MKISWESIVIFILGSTDDRLMIKKKKCRDDGLSYRYVSSESFREELLVSIISIRSVCTISKSHCRVTPSHWKSLSRHSESLKVTISSLRFIQGHRELFRVTWKSSESLRKWRSFLQIPCSRKSENQYLHVRECQGSDISASRMKEIRLIQIRNDSIDESFLTARLSCIEISRASSRLVKKNSYRFGITEMIRYTDDIHMWIQSWLDIERPLLRYYCPLMWSSFVECLTISSRASSRFRTSRDRVKLSDPVVLSRIFRVLRMIILRL